MLLEADIDTLAYGPRGTHISLGARATALRALVSRSGSFGSARRDADEERELAAEVEDIRARREFFEIEADLDSVQSQIAAAEEIVVCLCFGGFGLQSGYGGDMCSWTCSSGSDKGNTCN